VRYQQDASFVHTIEAALPAGAMVLELPYVSFPEAMRAPGQRLEDYELLKSYFHSRALHWSHPAMRGRVQDAWIQKISLRAPAWLVTSLTAAGFDAILINRRGYADSGAELEKAIARELGAPPIVGSDGRLAFFSLVEHARRLHAGLSAAALERQRDLAQHPIVMRFTSGCSGIEHGKAGDFRWCGAIGEIDIDNDARVEQAATLTTGLFAGKPPTKVTIEGDLLAETVDIPASGQPFVRTLRVAPGSHRLRFRAVGQPVDAPEDSRWPHLIWGVQNPRLEEIAPAP